MTTIVVALDMSEREAQPRVLQLNAAVSVPVLATPIQLDGMMQQLAASIEIMNRAIRQ